MLTIFFSIKLNEMNTKEELCHHFLKTLDLNLKKRNYEIVYGKEVCVKGIQFA